MRKVRFACFLAVKAIFSDRQFFTEFFGAQIILGGNAAVSEPAHAQVNMEGQTSNNLRRIFVSILWTRVTLENWRAKLISLLLATTVWYLIKKNVEATPPVLGSSSSPTPVTEMR
jgi:hypothetical protein